MRPGCLRVTLRACQASGDGPTYGACTQEASTICTPATTTNDVAVGESAAQGVGVPAVPLCPICSRPLRKYWKCKPLYDVKVCKKCRNSLAYRRHAAYLVDIIIISLLGQGIMLLLVILPVSPGNTPLLGLGAILSSIGYYAMLLARDGISGQSPGKALFGIQVVDVYSREPIGLGQSVKRNLPLLLPIIGVVVIILTMAKGQRWGDRWANTMVLRRRYSNRVPYAPPGAYCRSCGYNLTGNLSGRCPECGIEVPPEWMESADEATTPAGL